GKYSTKHLVTQNFDELYSRGGKRFSTRVCLLSPVLRAALQQLQRTATTYIKYNLNTKTTKRTT
ncbi:unnamed protein product, partial [Amoebophrya sp. A25]